MKYNINLCIEKWMRLKIQILIYCDIAIAEYLGSNSHISCIKRQSLNYAWTLCCVSDHTWSKVQTGMFNHLELWFQSSPRKEIAVAFWSRGPDPARFQVAMLAFCNLTAWSVGVCFTALVLNRYYTWPTMLPWKCRRHKKTNFEAAVLANIAFTTKRTQDRYTEYE